MNPAVSIICPVYNKEKYLDACIASFLAQTLQDIQVILIDDGSSDGSSAICSAYAARDSRILYCKIQNSGVSAARNTGISLATGDYVIFPDADDTIDAGMLADMYTAAKAGDADMVICGIKDYPFPSGPVPRSYRLEQLKQLHPVQFNSSSNKLFRRSILQEHADLRFFEASRYFEDVNFVLKFLHFSTNVCVVPACMYNYCRNEDSATSSTTFQLDPAYRKVLSIISTFADAQDFLHVHGASAAMMRFFRAELDRCAVNYILLGNIQNCLLFGEEVSPADVRRCCSQIKDKLQVFRHVSIKSRCIASLRFLLVLACRNNSLFLRRMRRRYGLASGE